MGQIFTKGDRLVIKEGHKTSRNIRVNNIAELEYVEKNPPISPRPMTQIRVKIIKLKIKGVPVYDKYWNRYFREGNTILLYYRSLKLKNTEDGSNGLYKIY